MPEYYYQIKGRSEGGEYHSAEWIFPPVFSGLVTAENRKRAKEMIEDDYGRKFPSRVLKKDMDAHHYLLQLRELNEHDPGDTYIRRRFEFVPCKECGTPFRLIDKYNQFMCDCLSPDYCKLSCKEAARLRDVQEFREASQGRLPAVIYQVRQKSTGKVYIGQTINAFTLRWWQHLTTPSDSKFHEALKATAITDWEFSVVEVISFPEGCDNKRLHVTDRERHWIETMNSVESGYNTILPSRQTPQALLELTVQGPDEVLESTF
ncbi:GIY-YIG nuclease family protein [Pseudomonas syringae pv. actinidiae]|nr:GIY-YIG nuclease family protein [Pseudomonas syringae pv. actinidiae]